MSDKREAELRSIIERFDIYRVPIDLQVSVMALLDELTREQGGSPIITQWAAQKAKETIG